MTVQSTDTTVDLPHGMFIHGEWRTPEGSVWIDVLDPSTELAIGAVPSAGHADVEDACASAADGFRVWRHLSSWERSARLRAMSAIIRRDEDALARIITLEQGKPLSQSLGEVRASADQFDWCADEARRVYGRIVPAQNPSDRIFVTREPIGPVVAFAPWNFPMLLPGRKVSAALAAGCSVILVAPIESPYSSLMLARAGDEAGLPPGTLNVLTGDPAALAPGLIDSPHVRKVTITSSVPVGMATMARAAASVKPVTLELGGHAPVVVLPGRRVKDAARTCALGKFRNAGQVCISASRFIVSDRAVDEFVETFANATRTLRLGPGMDPSTDVGPLSSDRRRQAIDDLVQDAVGLGAELIAGGRRPAQFNAGFYYEPTILIGVQPHMRVLTEETFGPIAPVQAFGDVDEAITLANSTAFGLAGFVFTDDLEAGLRVAERLDVGMVGINNLTVAIAEAPFGGVKASGFGREGGTEGVEEFLVTKYINARMDEPESLVRP